jgi:DNA-binding transcriptional LysR family regulator
MRANVHDNDLKLLRVFKEVARHQGFSAAQDSLNATQSAISMNMAQLEDRLGMRLCERGVKGFQLTDQGKVVLEAADRLFVALDDFRTETERVKGNISGTLRLGVVDNISFNSEYQLPDVILKLKQLYPDLSIDIFVGAPQDLEERLLDGRVRAAIGLFHRKLPKLHYLRLFTEAHELFCGDSHPFFAREDETLSDTELLGVPYVGRDYLDKYENLIPPLPFQAVASSPYMEGLANLILSGGYLAYLPTQYANLWVSHKKMRSIRPSDFRREADINLVYRKSRNMASELKALVTIIGKG